jgi:homospermidine synthase
MARHDLADNMIHHPLLFPLSSTRQKGTLPLIIKHLDMPASKITVFTLEDMGKHAAAAKERSGERFPTEIYTRGCH